MDTSSIRFGSADEDDVTGHDLRPHPTRPVEDDDVEGHAVKCKVAPSREDEDDDVEGHAAKCKVAPSPEEDDDVEGRP